MEREDGNGMRPAWLLPVTLLAGCVASPVVVDDLEGRIKAYYDAHAIEEGGECETPKISSVTMRRMVEAGPEQTVMRVRYNYFDPGVGDVATWRQVLIADRACTGTAERDFTFVERKTGYEVVGMSGEHRGAP
jgi:hypothetical protein